ncbi:17792_t:CDS:2 [Gigaspora margarita]|uniref:17792_t:CDS:1 n=1 Tax=Gigaspora margarita TaxID=4874 RepID=A0ABN7UGK5_GIGMA|nr:17792_t:CDS:2 [Gigaspora margarita]
MVLRGCATIIVNILIITAILLSFFTLPILDIPLQVAARFTGYPTWHGKLQHYDSEAYDTANWFFIITNVTASIYTIIWASKRDLPKKFITYIYQENGSRIPANFFNNFIAYYISMTAISGIAFFILDFGKLFSTFSVLHNIFEVGILLLLFQGGKIITNNFYAAVGGYAMCIIFTRIYLATRDYVREQTAALLPLANDEEHLPSDDAASISPKIIEHPDQLLLLIFASFIHIIGNIFTVIFSGDGRA